MSRNRHGDYIEFRKKYPEFIYSGYAISDCCKSLELDFRFVIPGLAEFRPHWNIAKPAAHSCGTDDRRLDALVFSLGMVELASYWKTTCSPRVRIACGHLSEEQSGWWKKLYRNGLGEFFYTNGIEAGDDFMDITSQPQGSGLPEGKKYDSAGSRVLVPIGGGKDSAVTLELLKGYAERFCYMINPRKACIDTVRAGDVPEGNVVIAGRTLDENMLALNEQGFLNGHTPFSALVAFSSVIAAYVNGIDYVAFSNESSANEPTIPGSEVNHQYSKSFEFETDFLDYESRYISTGIKCFSLLRPLSEIGIAGIFSRYGQYHDIFRSCNAGSREDRWCGRCPKCLFVYITLSPFIPGDKMAGIFGRNLLDDAGLLQDFKKLIGLEPEKPFECVGRRDEVNAAVQELIRQYETDGRPLPELLEFYRGLDIREKYDIRKICTSFDENNHVPERFIGAVKDALDRFGGERA